MTGPRQVGKTTLARQVIRELNVPTVFANADEPALKPPTWLEEQWEACRLIAREKKEALLILDEVQKLPYWSETVKKLWDEDTVVRCNLKVVLLGSSPLLMQKGLSESLAGRFEIIPLCHWSFIEMQHVFGWDLDTYLFYGGYPGSAALVSQEDRWRNYILDSLIETSISRDILLLNRIDKPALLRRLFQLACEYSAQILSYQKILGQLQDAGNTTTLAHYLDLLSGAGLVMGIMKYAGEKVRQRGSSPKLLVLNNALMTAQSHLSFAEAKKDRDFWGRIVESAVGSHLVNSMIPLRGKVYYWNAGSREVDFVLELGKKIIGIEVKSSMKKMNISGMEQFKKEFKPDKILCVGGHGIPLADFFQTSPGNLF